MAGARQQAVERERRKARAVGAGGFLAAAVVPVVLFHRTVALVAMQFQWELRYLTGWLPWVLLAAGLLFLLPVAASAGMNPESRFVPRARAAYAGWGVSLYLLGMALGSQVVQLQGAGEPG